MSALAYILCFSKLNSGIETHTTHDTLEPIFHHWHVVIRCYSHFMSVAHIAWQLELMHVLFMCSYRKLIKKKYLKICRSFSI